MDGKSKEKDQIDVNFESHPPIETDSDNVARLLRQTFIKFVDCHSLAEHIVKLKDISQVICLEGVDEENVGEDEEPDDDIYGVTSVIDLREEASKDSVNGQLRKFLSDRSSHVKELLDSKVGVGLIINERYINLPPQLALPTLENLTKNLEESGYSYLILVSKILIKSKDRKESELPNKKAKSSKQFDDEPLVFVNSEEEIIFEQADKFSDLDVSSYGDENATWSFSNSTKYIPHRRIMIFEYQKWPTILKLLREELSIK